MSVDFSALAGSVVSGLPEVRSCVLLSRDGLSLGGSPDEDEPRVAAAYATIARLGDVTRGFVATTDETVVFVRRVNFAAVAAVAPSGRPGVVLEALEQTLAAAEEAKARRDGRAAGSQREGDPGWRKRPVLHPTRVRTTGESEESRAEPPGVRPLEPARAEPVARAAGGDLTVVREGPVPPRAPAAGRVEGPRGAPPGQRPQVPPRRPEAPAAAGSGVPPPAAGSPPRTDPPGWAPRGSDPSPASRDPRGGPPGSRVGPPFDASPAQRRPDPRGPGAAERPRAGPRPASDARPPSSGSEPDRPGRFAGEAAPPSRRAAPPPPTGEPAPPTRGPAPAPSPTAPQPESGGGLEEGPAAADDMGEVDRAEMVREFWGLLRGDE